MKSQTLFHYATPDTVLLRAAKTRTPIILCHFELPQLGIMKTTFVHIDGKTFYLLVPNLAFLDEENIFSCPIANF
jgi:hypothetical protein